MTLLMRCVLCVCVLVLTAAGFASRAGSEPLEAGGYSPAPQLAMTPAPLAGEALPAPLVEPAALLCGNRWVNTKYVLPQNCKKACANTKHTPAQCAKLVPVCLSCWRQLQACASDRRIPPRQRCAVCTRRYAACMKPFF